MKLILKQVRIAFPDLFVAKQYEGAGPFSYGATFLIDPKSPAYQEVVKAIGAVAKDAFADQAEKILKAIVNNSQKCCFYNGDTKEYDGFAGNYALSCKRPQEAGHPKVVDQKMNELSSADGKPYGGSYVNASVDIWAQDNKWGKGIRATLIAVQFVKDGDAFTATGPASTDGFSEEADDASELI